MPIEIKELVIRAIVDDDRSPSDPVDGTRAELVEECVQEVLRILQRSRER